MSLDISEKGFEANIEESLLKSGYEKRTFNKEQGDLFRKHSIDFETFFRFLESTQTKELERLHKALKDGYKERIIDRFCKELKSNGMIHCLRHGIKLNGERIRLAFNKPSSSLNYLLLDQYNKNIFTVSRQVYYSTKNTNSMDMMISLNGLPIAVLELKNQLTGQNVEDSKFQFMNHRVPKESLFTFKERAIVFFAVDTDEVYMTTRLNNEKTFFMPFNKGNNGGKGNPPCKDNYKTSGENT